jgi:hypothetical protein
MTHDGLKPDGILRVVAGIVLKVEGVVDKAYRWQETS